MPLLRRRAVPSMTLADAEAAHAVERALAPTRAVMPEGARRRLGTDLMAAFDDRYVVSAAAAQPAAPHDGAYVEHAALLGEVRIADVEGVTPERAASVVAAVLAARAATSSPPR